ncbi:hypothetical protein DYB30_013943, partial [Aphanomyces astaci]
MKHSALYSMCRVAKSVDKDNHRSAVAEVYGDVLLTPIQRLNFAHPWNNVHFWNLSITQECSVKLNLSDLNTAVTILVAHHDMLRARFRRNGSEWTQHVMTASDAGPPLVECVDVDGFASLESAILNKEQSLHLTDGPLFCVTVFDTPDASQYIHLTMHHAIADLVSWRILLSDLQALLSHKALSAKTTSFQEWASRLERQAVEWDPLLWSDYMCDDVLPPSNASVYNSTRHRIVLDPLVAMQLDKANETYGTNIQELALAALTGALNELHGDRVDLCVMLEGHGRDAWDSSLDVSSTVGWFTSEYPVVLSATETVAGLVRQVKQKLRGVPHHGLSYGAIKYLAPSSWRTERIKLHRRHNLSFNYTGRFQEVDSAGSRFFRPVQGLLHVPQHGPDEQELSPGSLLVSHGDGTILALDMHIPEWALSPDQVRAWGALWCKWMHLLVHHCLDSATIGGRTLSDVPLLQSTETVLAVEAEMLNSLGLRPLDVQDVYPVTPLQAGFLVALMDDPAAYVLQVVLDVCGDLSLDRLQRSWHRVSQDISFLRTTAVASEVGMYQAVTKQDWSEWTMLDESWSVATLVDSTTKFLVADRRRGFTLASKSFHRFTGVRVSGTMSRLLYKMLTVDMLDGRMRLFWTHHHSIMDGWSLPLVMDNLVLECYGDTQSHNVAPFKEYVEWLALKDGALSREFWTMALEHADKTAKVALAKPLELHGGDLEMYRSHSQTLVPPQLTQVCKLLEVTPSSIFRTAWAIVLQQYTQSNHVVFGS